jgi:hypothetical protein
VCCGVVVQGCAFVHMCVCTFVGVFAPPGLVGVVLLLLWGLGDTSCCCLTSVPWHCCTFDCHALASVTVTPVNFWSGHHDSVRRVAHTSSCVLIVCSPVCSNVCSQHCIDARPCRPHAKLLLLCYAIASECKLLPVLMPAWQYQSASPCLTCVCVCSGL